ncbi:Parathyroid hormone 2 receptor, partial [Chelonia mydas]
IQATAFLTAVFYAFFFSIQVDSDDTITTEEQIYLLLEAKIQCELNLTTQLQEGDNACELFTCTKQLSVNKILTEACFHESSTKMNAKSNGLDHILCMAQQAVITVEIFRLEIQSWMAFRHCSPNGTWDLVQGLNRTWANYSDCLRYLQPEISPGKREFFERLYTMYTVGYSMSFSSLAVAVFIIGYFRRLHCTRNCIHMHLFVSFMLRAASIFIKDKVVHTHIGVKELDSLLMSDLQSTAGAPAIDKSQYVGCKIAVVMFIYFLATNYYWILVEGLYLHSLIFVAFFSDTKYLWGFTLIGWAKDRCTIRVPGSMYGNLNVKEKKSDDKNNGPVYLLLCLSMAPQLNFILFLNTVRVLATKIWETNAVGYDTRKQYRKLAKSTLILILVFGVHYIVFVCLPHTFTGLGWQIRMHCELFFNSFQGFFVSIIYCYCNGEVQTEIKKTWTRWNLAIDWKRTTPCGNYRYGSVLTNMTHSTSSQSQMVASSRMVLISSKVCRNASRQNEAHMNLPGYVRSNSEQDCVHHWVREEANENEEKQVDDISLKESLRPRGSSTDPEQNRVEMEEAL